VRRPEANDGNAARGDVTPGGSEQEEQRSVVGVHVEKAEGNQMPGMMTVADVAARLNVSESAVYDLVATKRLACHRIGRKRGTIRFTEAHMEAYLASTLQPADATPSASAPASSGQPAGPFSELDPARLARAWKGEG
jgi:excisionase family DNA binding protein